MSNLGQPYFRMALDTELYYLPEYAHHVRNLIGILQQDANQIRSQVLALSQQQKSEQMNAIVTNGQDYHGFVQQLVDIMNQGNTVTDRFNTALNDAINYAELIGYSGTQVIILAFEQYINTTRLLNEGRDYMADVLVTVSNTFTPPTGQQPAPGTYLSSDDFGYLSLSVGRFDLCGALRVAESDAESQL